MELGEYANVAEQHQKQLEFFWKVKCAKQGQLKTENTHNRTDFKGYSRILAVQWGAANSVDEHTGSVSGRHTMEPLIVTKYIDQASPQIMQALLNHEVITESEFVYVDYPAALAGKALGANAAEKMTKIFVVEGKQGFVAKVECGSTAEGRFLERITLIFNDLTWNHLPGSTMTTWKRSDAN